MPSEFNTDQTRRLRKDGLDTETKKINSVQPIWYNTSFVPN